MAGLLGLSSTVAAQQPVPLDTLEVTAGTRLVAGAAVSTRSVDVLRRADIEALPARTVSDVLSRGLGVDLQPRSPAQADLSIRGSSFEQVLVLVDGVPVNDDQTGHFHLDTAVPVDAVERIEVLRGPAAAVYGSSAIGGVVNIVTRRGRNELMARAEGGSFGSLALSADAGVARERFSARVSAGHDRSDGHRPGTDHRITQALLTTDGAVAGGALRLDLAHAQRDFGASAFYAPFDSYEETRVSTASVSWRGSGVAWSVEPRVSFRRHDDDFILLRDNPSFYHNRHTTDLLSGEVVSRWVPRTDMRLALGASGARSSIESNSLGERTEDRTALFAEFAAGEAEGSLITAGLRLDRHEVFGTFLSPSVAAGFSISPAFRLRASGGTGFRAPTWTERFYVDPANIGNPEVEPERFRTVELSGELSRGRALVSLTGYIRDADDLIDWGRPDGAAPTAAWRTMNVESATFRGLELAARLQTGRATLTGRGSLLSLDAEEHSGFTSKYALRPLTRSLSMEAVLPVAAARLGLRAAHLRRAEGGDWSLLDARVSMDVGALELFATATNLLDEQYADITGHTAPGRALSAGLRVVR